LSQKGDDGKMAERQSDPVNKHCSSTRSERKDAVESRCRILGVARKLFGERGVESVSMHQIAKSAQVGQGTLYRRYAHKGELCLDLLKESADEFMQQITVWISESQDKMSDFDVLENVIVRIIDFTDSKSHLLTVINSSRFVGENIFYRRLHEIVSILIERIMKKSGEGASSLDVTFTADILLSAVSPALYMFEREIRGYSKEQFIAGIRRIYFSGLFLGGPQNL
jgi:AcrR family transcriptional regulator